MCLQRKRHLSGPYAFLHRRRLPLSHRDMKGVVSLTRQRAGLAKRLTWHHVHHPFETTALLPYPSGRP